MELGTVTQIRTLRDNIREKIKTISKSQYATTTYGGENEYTFKGVLGGVDALLTDISCLTKWPNKFVKFSTHAERNTIIQYLTRIDTHFNNPANYIAQFEALKVLLRNYNVRSFSERQIEFEQEIEEVLKLKLQVQEELFGIKEIQEEIKVNKTAIEEKFEASSENLEKIEIGLSEIEQQRDALIENVAILGETNQDILSLKEASEENFRKSTDSLSECKSNEKLITSFANRVQERDKRLNELEQNTAENNQKLQDYEKERVSILNEATSLINSAKKALNYKTAEGISAAFQEHYGKANNYWIFGGWIAGSMICLIMTILLGLWVLENSSNEIGIIIGRISLLPLPIIGAVFCANQYTKQKNIIEDYAYKMVLSKAIVGFSEQLKKNGSEDNQEYVHYIKTALEEIHKDPLRKREKGKEEKVVTPGLKDLVEVAEKIVKMSKLE
ncbi:hypothetical protein [Labilibaculum manganireducens]|uniref:hypothetical protein n=1 Tax=Labilibaculum manganireducens TaxID=1940525 RepID=UPI0029F585B9|nr:hypothetical protein [Labilibaculum manganireducens]